VADSEGRYEALPAPLHWIKGNNENFDAIDAGVFLVNLNYLPNGRVAEVGGIRVAGLGGTFAPSWYDTPASALPHPRKGSAKATELADKRRHFVREEVDACRQLTDVDVLLTHEAPRPYFAGTGARRNDAGKTPVNEILSAMRPRLHLFGHHHRFTEQERQGVRSIGLDPVGQSYLLIDARTFEYDRQQ
jgi:Icc-related predicted phosphoesterase